MRKKVDWCNYFNEEGKENTHKGQKYWGAGEVDGGGEGNPWVRGIRKPEMAERDQERETMDNISCAIAFLVCKS